MLSGRNASARIVLTLLVALGLAACSSAPDKASPFRESDGPTGPVLDNLVARVYQGSDLAVELQATRAVLDLTAGTAVLQSVLVSFFEEGKIRGRLSSDEGTLFLDDQPGTGFRKDDFLLSGHVTLEDLAKVSVTAPQMRYDSQGERLVSGGGRFEKRVRTTGGHFICTGKWFEVDRRMTNFVDHDGVRLQFVADNGSQGQEGQGRQ